MTSSFFWPTWTHTLTLHRFIQPPSISALEARLRGRNTETEDSLKKRLESAQSAIEYASLPGSYDLVVVNDDLDTAYNELETFILSNWGIDCFFR